MEGGRSTLDLLSAAVALALSLFQAGCADDAHAPEESAATDYRLVVSEEEFVVRVQSAEQAQALDARLASGQEGVISGELATGDGGYNSPWSWHLDPASVHVPDLAIEVCDGRPSMVEEDLEYWLGTVERFCPWGATVVRRLD